LVDIDSPAAICNRLGQIEDRLAFVTNEVSRAAYWRKKYSTHLDRLGANLYPQTSGTIPERKFELEKLLGLDPATDSLAEAEAQYAKYAKEFEGLDTRRSILQSCLKVHTREQEPRFGEGSHHR
jgi:hypothetical protein